MNRFRVYGLTCVLMLLAGSAARATTIVLPTDEQLVEKSPVIVEGTVLSTMAIQTDGAIYTDTVVSVARNIKGETAGTITVRELGGIVDDRITKIYGAPEFTPGERVMLFLEQSPRGGYRTMDLFVGKFAEGRTENGRRLWMRKDYEQDATLLNADFQPVETKNVQRDAAGFETFVAERIAGRRGAKNYAIENPVLAPGDESGVKTNIRSEFTLIAEPTLYRWFAFDDGKAANWYYSGSQPGYTDGGLTEMKTGMSAWTSYSGAKIRYAFAGALSSGVQIRGLDSTNGYNEVLFSDPLNEIAGSYNRSTGGVVGLGGFNGVSSSRTWTAPFTADATHQAGSQKAWNVIEGNLTIQDGVAGNNGISSAVLAEILAHEFGHTLGFGHNETDSTALMYPSVTRLGPSLRADDQLAARWLYPNTSGSPDPVPVTPAVIASFDMSTTSATTGTNVTFTDRSTGAPTRWAWVFGDGATSTAQNPVHTFASAGTYTVKLTASNATSTSTTTRQLTVASNAVTAYRTLLSVAAQTSGVGGTSWRTELNFFNAGNQGATVSMLFLPSAGGSLVSRSIFLGPRQSVSYANALLDLFGISTGAGAMTIDATSGSAAADLRVTSRTFTTGGTGTYGQAVPNVETADLERTLYLTGIASNARFRTNIGLVNRGGTAISASLSLVNASGATVATRSMSINGSSFQQLPLNQLFSGIDGATYDVLSMRITATSRDAISAYASVVDNATQDPIYIQAVPAATGGALTIPVVGRAPGANGTFWRSDVTLFNPSGGQVSYTLRYGGASKTISVGAGDTAVLSDVVSSFGQSAGNGTLVISWGSAAGPVATSRTYTTVATGGTFGQSIDPVDAFSSRAFVPGLRNDASYRSNVGFVNGGASSEAFTVILLSPSGQELARTAVTLGPNALAQYAVSSLFPNVNLGNGFTLQLAGDSDARLFAYGSMVDNRSGDPVFFAGR